MKKIIFLASISLFPILYSCQTSKKEVMHSTTNNEEQTIIHQLLTDLFEGADQRDWAKVRNTMADKIYVDYSALGGAVGFTTPEELIGNWKALLPGFERTIHQLHNIAIWSAGERATATMDAIATHYLQADEGPNFWTVFVGYDTELLKEDGQWKLARIDLSLYDQTGNQALPMKALQRVEANQSPTFTTTSQAEESVERFFEALEATDLSAFLDNLSDEAVQEMPFSPDGFPKKLAGKAAIEQQYTGVMNYQQRYERSYFPTLDPKVVLVKFRGIVETESGKEYNNYYVGIFEVDDAGKIKHFVEHFNPNILLEGWTGLQPASYSVHAAGAKRDGGVTMDAVQFSSQGVHLKGHLFLPPAFDASQKYPTIIVTGSWTSVKEQMPDEYASLLAQQGWMALTFDFTGFGESEGEPRQLENPQLKIKDIRAAVDFLEAHQNVDAGQITGLGICASSGYMAHAVAEDQRINQLVLVAPWLHDAAIARTIYDLRPGGTDGLIAASQKAQEQYAETGVMEYVLAASELDPLSAMYVPENAFDYYLDPAKAAGAHYDNRFAVSSWEPWLTFDGIGSAKGIQQPVLIVHSESGAVPQGAKTFYDQLDTKKEIIWLNDFNQQQLYFEAEAVNAAIATVSQYLKQS